MVINADGDTGHCSTCELEKAKRVPTTKRWGTGLRPIHQTSNEGYRYAVGFIDSFSRFCAIYPKKTKEEVVGEIIILHCRRGHTRHFGIGQRYGIQIQGILQSVCQKWDPPRVFGSLHAGRERKDREGLGDSDRHGTMHDVYSRSP